MTTPSSSAFPDGGRPAIEVRELHKYFGENEVLKGIDFDVTSGQVVCVIGPSGSGKSTLLRCVNRLEEPTSGKIFVEGVDITDPEVDLDGVRSRIGMVFQQFNLFPHLSVLRNITLGPIRVRKIRKEEAEERAMQLLTREGIPEQALKYPAQLSGGQQQRVAIARALANGPALILADEPTGELDSQSGRKILTLFRKIVEEQGVTVVMATHDAVVDEYASAVYVLRDGRIEVDAAL